MKKFLSSLKLRLSSRRAVLSCVLLAGLFLAGASRVQIFLYQDPGFQGEWARSERQVITGTPLPYWHEGTLFTWVKVDLNPGSNVFYVYYGGENAPDKSSGDAVFEFFDDFEGTDLSTTKWRTTGCIRLSPANYQISNGLLYIWGDLRALCGRYNVDSSKRIVVEEKVYLEGLDSGHWYLGIVHGDGGWYFIIQEDKSSYGTPNKNVVRYVGACGSYYYRSFSLYDVGNMWHIARIEKSGDNTYTAQILDLNYNVLATYTDNAAAICYLSKYAPVYRVQSSSNRMVVDWVRIRKYAPSPTVYYGPREWGEFVIGDRIFTKRRKVEVVSSVQVSGYQVALDYSQWGERGIEVVR